MGYHIILNKNQSEIEHYFVNHFFEIANYEISETTIIYEGDEKWQPEVVALSKKYQIFSTPRFRASFKAEQIFKQKANELGYIIETLNQDQESFKFYNDAIKNNEKYVYVKRGDFLIRNLLNLEIEVKCKTIFYDPKLKKLGPHFYLEKEHLDRHNNMFKFTKTPIIFAVFERNKKDQSKVNSTKLYMISLSQVNEIIDKYNLTPEYRSYGESYRISIGACKKNFELLNEYKKEIE
jgi:hypothetical protein